MLLLTFSKTGCDDVVLTEDDLFDFEYENGCFSGETFELGGVNARSLYLVIDNNTQRFSRGTFANARVLLEINGYSYGYFNIEQPKRRNGIIELTAYDDMIKLDVEYPSDYVFPQVFWSVYAQCICEAGLADNLSFDNIVNNGVFNNGVITADYTDYIYANSCRQLVSGMAEWNGGFCFINDDGKLQIQPFAKDISHSYRSGELMELDYSDETVVFSKIKTSQKNKTYEMGDDSGYTLVINNQYIQYGLDDAEFELMLGEIYNYYKGFALTPMTFTLAEPDLTLKLGERISVYDEEEDVTIVGNISKIVISGNLSMQITCGGFGNVASRNNFNSTSASQIRQAEETAKSTETHTAALTDYAILSDTSARCNGVTYDIEKDSATGLISKITDSLGNILLPSAEDGITDIDTHNAVLWAVAMAKGLSGITPLVLYDNGDLCTAASGGWEFVVRPNTSYTAEFRDDRIYIENNGQTSGQVDYNYVYAQTLNAIDLTGRSRLCITCAAAHNSDTDAATPVIGVTSSRVTTDTTERPGQRVSILTDGAVSTVSLDISAISGSCYIYVLAAEHNTLEVYKIWAE